jgi:hypothetical protein
MARRNEAPTFKIQAPEKPQKFLITKEEERHSKERRLAQPSMLDLTAGKPSFLDFRATARFDVLRQNQAADAEGTINAKTTMPNKI